MRILALILCLFTSLCYGGQTLEKTSAKKPTLVLYYSPWCPYCKKVLNHLDKMGKTVPMINLQATPKAKQELIKIGGKGQVPCLIIDGKAMYESSVIIKWFDKHPNYLLPAR